jgi:hypothetical protein
MDPIVAQAAYAAGGQDAAGGPAALGDAARRLVNALRERIIKMSLPGFSASNSLSTSSTKFAMLRLAQAGAGHAIEPQVSKGGGSASDCVETYQNCYIDCSVRYPESADSPNNLNSLMRQGCFDSCDAGYDLCSGAGAARISGRTGRIARLNAPVLR